MEIYRGSFLDVGDRRAWIIAPPREVANPIPAGQLVTGDLPLATERLRSGGWMVLSAGLAAEQHLHVGQSFSAALSTADGVPDSRSWHQLRLASGSDHAQCGRLSQGVGGGDPSALEVNLREGVTSSVGIRAVRGILPPSSGLAVHGAAQREGEFRATARQGLYRLSEISALVLIAAVLAMAATMGAMIWQRRSKIADMKVNGSQPWRALACADWESGLLLVPGVRLELSSGFWAGSAQSRALERHRLSSGLLPRLLCRPREHRARNGDSHFDRRDTRRSGDAGLARDRIVQLADRACPYISG